MEEFDQRALWSITYGLFVVTSAFEGRLNGQIANTVFQVTADPPRIAVALNKENYTHELVSKSGVLGVSILCDSTPLKFIGRFGFRSGKDFDKLEGIEFFVNSSGVPCVTENAVCVIEARVVDELDAGTHTVFLADVVGGRLIKDEKPLIYAEYRARKGKVPQRAPTYRASESE